MVQIGPMPDQPGELTLAQRGPNLTGLNLAWLLPVWPRLALAGLATFGPNWPDPGWPARAGPCPSLALVMHGLSLAVVLADLAWPGTILASHSCPGSPWRGLAAPDSGWYWMVGPGLGFPRGGSGSG